VVESEMALRFKCASCDRNIIVDDSMAGRTVRCGHCGAPNQAPQSATQKGDEKIAAAVLSAEEVEKKRAANRQAMGKDLRTWGIALIVLGVIHIVAAKLLNPIWGAIIIVLGILNLVIRERGMFVANGLALFLVGAGNIAASISKKEYGWIVLGVLQVVWGISEMKKFQRYREV
jgi:predicted Zn finger-like uncharacterized protein